MGHFLVYGWLHEAASFVKCRTVLIMSGWDNKENDALLKNIIGDIAARICLNDSAHGK